MIGGGEVEWGETRNKGVGGPRLALANLWSGFGPPASHKFPILDRQLPRNFRRQREPGGPVLDRQPSRHPCRKNLSIRVFQRKCVIAFQWPVNSKPYSTRDAQGFVSEQLIWQYSVERLIHRLVPLPDQINKRNLAQGLSTVWRSKKGDVNKGFLM